MLHPLDRLTDTDFEVERRVVVNEARQEYMTRVTSRAAWTIHACKARGFDLRAPAQPWRVDVEITPTFSPHALDPAIGDARQLGARVELGTIQLGSG